MVSREYDCTTDEGAAQGIADAASALRRGELVVLPTDTVYGVGADAFNPTAVAALLDTKGRDRGMPAPVLVGSLEAAEALVEDLGTHGRDLVEALWPGPLTVVCGARPGLTWDLGDTKGTVGVRMPEHRLALDLLNEVGPLAVSSANLSGQPPGHSAAEAREQLGDAVAVYLEAGPGPQDAEPSTIVDLTYAVPRILREGAVPAEDLRKICGTVIGAGRRTGTTRRRGGTATDTSETSETSEKADDSGAASGSGESG
jgi:L-threonylcarbamoyladenylate synthase